MKYIPLFVGIAAIYGFGAFVFWEPNAGNWDERGRAGFAMMSMLWSAWWFILFFIDDARKDKE